MLNQQLMRLLNNISQRFCFTGSQVIGGATPESDLDIVVQVEDYNQALAELVDADFTPDTSEDYADVSESNFVSAKKDKINIILVASDLYFEAWLEATQLACGIHMAQASKEYRHELFRAVWREKGLSE